MGRRDPPIPGPKMRSGVASSSFSSRIEWSKEPGAAETFNRMKGVYTLLTESEVQKNFRRLFTSSDITSEALEKAGKLIDQLRLESPLRHRLSEELDEIKKLVPAK